MRDPLVLFKKSNASNYKNFKDETASDLHQFLVPSKNPSLHHANTPFQKMRVACSPSCTKNSFPHFPPPAPSSPPIPFPPPPLPPTTPPGPGTNTPPVSTTCMTRRNCAKSLEGTQCPIGPATGAGLSLHVRWETAGKSRLHARA